MAKVTLTNVLNRLELYTLKEGKNVVGRSIKANDVNIPGKNAYVSKKQCIIYVTDGEVKIEDTNSKNGTYIGQSGKPIGSGKKHDLKDGNIIVFGKKYSLEVGIEDGEELKIRIED